MRHSTSWIYTEEDLAANANYVKSTLLAQLQNDGVIEDAEKLDLTYVFVVKKKGLFGRAWGKLWASSLTDKNVTDLTILKINR